MQGFAKSLLALGLAGALAAREPTLRFAGLDGSVCTMGRSTAGGITSDCDVSVGTASLQGAYNLATSCTARVQQLEAERTAQQAVNAAQVNEAAAMRTLITGLREDLNKLSKKHGDAIADSEQADTAFAAADADLRIAVAAVAKMQGPKGERGETGAKGETGKTGAQGPKGDTGTKGDTSAQGAVALPLGTCVQSSFAPSGGGITFSIPQLFDACCAPGYSPDFGHVGHHVEGPTDAVKLIGGAAGATFVPRSPAPSRYKDQGRHSKWSMTFGVLDTPVAAGKAWVATFVTECTGCDHNQGGFGRFAIGNREKDSWVQAWQGMSGSGAGRDISKLWGPGTLRNVVSEKTPSVVPSNADQISGDGTPHHWRVAFDGKGELTAAVSRSDNFEGATVHKLEASAWASMPITSVMFGGNHHEDYRGEARITNLRITGSGCGASAPAPTPTTPAPLALGTGGCPANYVGYATATSSGPSGGAKQTVYCRNTWMLLNVNHNLPDGGASVCGKGDHLPAIGNPETAADALATGTAFALSNAWINNLRGSHKGGIFRLEKQAGAKTKYTYFKGDGKDFRPSGTGNDAFNACAISEHGPWHHASPYFAHAGLNTYRQEAANQCGDYVIYCYKRHTASPNIKGHGQLFVNGSGDDKTNGVALWLKTPSTEAPVTQPSPDRCPSGFTGYHTIKWQDGAQGGTQSVYCRDGWALLTVVQANPDRSSSACGISSSETVGDPAAAAKHLADGTKFSLSQSLINALRGPQLGGIFRVEKKRSARTPYTYFQQDGKRFEHDGPSIDRCSTSETGPWFVAHHYGAHKGLNTYKKQGTSECGDYLIWCYRRGGSPGSGTTYMNGDEFATTNAQGISLWLKLPASLLL
jgi:hypothetical protein